MSDVVEIKHDKYAQQGINLSFTVKYLDKPTEKFSAGVLLERFHQEIQAMRREHFPAITATVTSRQEYYP